jgi:hypothetical protein
MTVDVRESLLKGMKAMNRELDEVIARMEQKTSEPAEPTEPPA